MDEHPLDLNQIPKQLCENVLVGANGESFMLGMIVGNNLSPFALTPEHAKRLAKLLAEKVAIFEREYRPIDEEQKIPSPMQISDLGDDPA
ncbi:MAG: hypothetical protein KGI78_00615 [Patescibacteria group bacterium]|nr:hypothetical protein [Patescibacteria group bacterium]MDE1944055.1 hypothetical protein [Patescibacteria group bacterium]MDE1944911.1 hypothetical protein [Patescibacteria group bacterium]MDE2057341.1 hypothetical protein [Patescibacteria group bacterium]